MTEGDWSLEAALAVETLQALRSANRILMPTHQNVDADGLGSPLALMHALAPLGVQAVPLVSDGQLPASLDFLPGIDRAVFYGRDRLPDRTMIPRISAGLAVSARGATSG